MRLSAAALLCALLPGVAEASEVVWLDRPTDVDAARVAALAQAQRGPLTVAAFRALLTDRTPADDAALDEVERVLAEVRVHEQVLDGERLIMEALQRPLQAATLVRDPRDRETLVRALLYQGFAVDRYWGDNLGQDPAAGPYRMRLDDAWVETSWVDAFGLDPVRKAGPSDIAEAPQRHAYDSLRQRLSRALPVRLVVPDLPEGAQLLVDGSPRVGGEATVVELLPGRHWVHVELDGHVIHRQADRLDPGERVELRLPLPESNWYTVMRLVRGEPGTVPSALEPFLDALGGEVWLAEGRGSDLRVVRLTAAGVQPVALPSSAPPTDRTGPLGDVSLATWLGPTWVFSPDFRDQDPAAVPSGAGVEHGVGGQIGLELTWDRSWLRYGLGVLADVPVGAHQVALTGAGAQRARLYPHVVLGHPRVQATFGPYLPYHWLGGLQTTVPLVDLVEGQPLELRAGLRAGATGTLLRADGSSWTGGPLLSASVSVGVRLSP